MANDTDMWNDIEELERTGQQKQADELLGVFHQKFNEGNEKKAEKLKERYEEKWNIRLKYW